MALILSSKPIVEEQTKILTQKCTDLKKQGKNPFLKVILVGNNPASITYTTNKKKFCEKVGAQAEIIHLPENTQEAEFKKLVQEINSDPSVNGILIQLPVPDQLKHLNLNKMISKEKDVDGFHPENIFDLVRGKVEKNSLLPCTPKGIVELFKFYNIEVEGKQIAVLGRSMIVGKPMGLLLNSLNATVTFCHSKTKNLTTITKQADIVISAIGKPELIGKDYFRNDQTQIVVDVGMNKNKMNQLCGDVDFKNVEPMVKAITPVPGGVGPLTILSLVKNLITACENL